MTAPGSATAPGGSPALAPVPQAPTVAVAICTSGERPTLSRAIESVLGQADAADQLLVIVNAAPTIPPPAAAWAGRVDLVTEPRAGLDFARNRALETADTEVVVFLDDDAVAGPGWVSAFRAAFRDRAELGACTGRVEPREPLSEGARVIEGNGGLAGGPAAIRLPADAATRRLNGYPAPLVAWAASLGSGCNLAVRRSDALALGGFDPALDLGPALPGGGDIDLIWRLLRAGREVRHVPEAAVRHEHRASAIQAYAQIIGHQRGLIAFLTKTARAERGIGRFTVLAFLAWRLVKPGVRLVRRALGRDPLPARVLTRMWWECLRGLRGYDAARRIAALRTGEADR